jgi:hypothetical protein
MYVVRVGFLDGRYGFMIAFFYAFQDYVAKTKYLEMRQKSPKLRLAFQKYVARGCTTLGSNVDHDFSLKSNKVVI